MPSFLNEASCIDQTVRDQLARMGTSETHRYATREGRRGDDGRTKLCETPSRQPALFGRGDLKDRHLIMVMGGARSGKSLYAETLAPPEGQLIYVATAEAGDHEMRDRIDAHRKRRSDNWMTIEAPYKLPSVIAHWARKNVFLLVDCVTLWLANIMMQHGSAGREPDHLIRSLTEAEAVLVIVSGEVGMGIVPENMLARRFRDEMGDLNQRIATICDEVTLVTAGLPLRLK